MSANTFYFQETRNLLTSSANDLQNAISTSVERALLYYQVDRVTIYPTTALQITASDFISVERYVQKRLPISSYKTKDIRAYLKNRR
eukprot:UN02150